MVLVAVLMKDKEFGTTEPEPGRYNYSVGSEVVLKAIPKEEYRLKEWVILQVSLAMRKISSIRTSEPIYTLTINPEWDIILAAAFFEEKPAELIIKVEPAGAGTTNPPEGKYECKKDSVMLLSAEANVGWRFVKWHIHKVIGDKVFDYDSSAWLHIEGCRGRIEATAYFEKEW